MELGVHLPQLAFSGETRTLADYTAFTREARETGYRYLCVNDHLVFSRPWLDGPSLLSAVLHETGDMRLMTTIALAAVRGPAPMAKALAAIDLLSAGRLTVGVGPGSSPRDYAAVGLDWAERWSRLDESIETMRALWVGRDYTGRHYSTGGLKFEPQPVQEPGPPIWIGSWGSEAGLRRVARLADGWLASGYNTTPTLFEKAWADVRASLAARGRDADGFPNGIATMWTFVSNDIAQAERVLVDVLAPMLNRPVEELREKLPVGTPEDAARKLAAYARAGAQRLFLWPVADEFRQLETVQRDVVPLLRQASGA